MHRITPKYTLKFELERSSRRYAFRNDTKKGFAWLFLVLDFRFFFSSRFCSRARALITRAFFVIVLCLYVYIYVTKIINYCGMIACINCCIDIWCVYDAQSSPTRVRAIFVRRRPRRRGKNARGLRHGGWRFDRCYDGASRWRRFLKDDYNNNNNNINFSRREIHFFCNIHIYSST